MKRAIPTVREWIVTTTDGRYRVLGPTRTLAFLNFRHVNWANIRSCVPARQQRGQRTLVEKDTPNTCPSCGREYSKMPNRERMLNGHMGHLEYDRETGATVLVDEGK
jgi:hypothetical protein